MISGDLPWVALKDRLSCVWSDTDDAGLRRFLEHEYGIDNAGKIHDGVELAMQERHRHPVREYLEGLAWDGEKRMESLFIKYLGAEDSLYTRAVTRAALIGAVARIMEPGCKHDHMLVLVGPQGCRKSTTLARLGKEWFSDSLFTMSGKEAFEQIQGYWIIELGELAAMKKSEIEQTKGFISKQADNYRSAYARRTQEHPRQCAFFGSTNDDEFLRDATGARRFWPVTVDNTGRVMADQLTEDLIDQIWAEAVGAYRAGEKWYLSEEAEAMARDVQEQHTEVSSKAGMIEEFVDRRIPADWRRRSLDERRWYWAEEEPETEDLVERTRICALEVWCELLGGDVKTFTQTQAREINAVLMGMKGWRRSDRGDCGKPYGRQRCFEKRLEILSHLLD